MQYYCLKYAYIRYTTQELRWVNIDGDTSLMAFISIKYIAMSVWCIFSVYDEIYKYIIQSKIKI